MSMSAEVRPRRADAADRGRERAVAGADAHLHRAEAAARDVALELLADALGGRPAAGGVGRERVPALAAEQAPHRDIEGAAEDVPAGHVDGADGADPAAAPVEHREAAAPGERVVGAAAAVAELPQAARIARVLADQRRAEVAVDEGRQRRVVAHAADRCLGLAPAHQPAFGLDTHDGGVEVVGDAEVAPVLLRLGDRHMRPARGDAPDPHRGRSSRRGVTRPGGRLGA